jgi:hypothetical protein
MTPELRWIFALFRPSRKIDASWGRAAGTGVVGMVVEELVWLLCLAYARTPPVRCCGMDSDRTLHTGAGGGCGRSSAIRRKISWNICRGMANNLGNFLRTLATPDAHGAEVAQRWPRTSCMTSVHLIALLPSLIHCSQVPRLLKATTRSAGRFMFGDNESDAGIKLSRVPFDLG